MQPNNGKHMGETLETGSSNAFGQRQAKPIEFNGRCRISSVTFLDDGKHIISGGDVGKLRRWRSQDGKEVGSPIEAGNNVNNIAVSGDGKWVVSGTDSEVRAWNMASREKMVAFKGHSGSVSAVDVSPDGTRIASGSDDKTVCVWSLSTGQRLLGPLNHSESVRAVKFSPDGCLIATATWFCESVRVYDSQDGRLLVDVPIKVSPSYNQSLAWSSGSKQLFAISDDGYINCLDVFTGKTHSQWRIHSNSGPSCIALMNNSTFIAASAGSSVSFWDTTTQEQIGSVIERTDRILSMNISANYVLAMGGGRTITVRSLHDILPSPYFYDVFAEQETQGVKVEEKADFEQKIGSLHAQEDSNSKITRLEKTIQQLCVQLSDSEKTIGLLHVQEMDSNTKITSLEETVQQLHAELTHSQQRTNGLVQILLAHERKHKCEALYAEGRIIDATVSLLETVNVVNEGDEVRANSLIMDWLTKFKNQLISTLEECGDEASSTGKQEEAFAAYSAVLSLGPSTSNTLLIKWARTVLIRSPAAEALSTAAQFDLPRFLIYRSICDVLDENGRALEATECFRRMQSELGSDTQSIDETEWATTFRARCLRTLEQRGDGAMDSASYKDATVQYTAALTLNPSSTDLLTKRSKAHAEIGSWGDSLEDADAAIKLNPSSPSGYERRHVALLGAQCYDEAIDAFKDMLVRFEQSSDPVTRKSRNNYASPSQTIAAIRSYVKRIQRDSPPILINTGTGRLYNKQERMDEFKADPKFKELVASITTKRDNSRIMETVQQYFRYATFSHTWEGVEPLFRDVLDKSVYELAASPSSTSLKLVMFCRTIQEAGLYWAWSDTCCIDATDSSVLQESLTSMFRWYRESVLTIVHLKGVLSGSELGALIESFWNTRGWTLQEFFASRAIRFYTEDWKPYLPRESAYNHKDSSVIVGEMATATGVDAQVLLSLQPGSDNVRQKLCLAAKRTTTRQEDMAYSLFGIFGVSISVTYGEGQQRALGRLLQEVLTRSGDVTILAWTGKASDFNSCLPAKIDAYHESASLHIPSPVGDDKMDLLVMELRTSFPRCLESAVELYGRVVALPSPRLVSSRLSLSCIIFPLRGPLALSDGSQDVYRTKVHALGNIEIKTTDDLSSFGNLVLVHPWSRYFLDPAHSLDDLVDDNTESPVSPTRDGGDGDPQSFPSHTGSPLFDRLTRALRLFVRLRQPFGALLLVPQSHNEYKRVASDRLINVQLLEGVLPQDLAQRIRTLDIL